MTAMTMKGIGMNLAARIDRRSRAALMTMIILAGMVLALAATRVEGLPAGLMSDNRVGAPGDRQPDAGALATLSDQVRQRARELAPDAVLRQLDIDPRDGRHIFHFTDAAATREIVIVAPTPVAPMEQWEISLVPPSDSKFVGHPWPEIDLSALRMGPAAAAQAITAYRADCATRGLMLFGEGTELTWHVSCAVPQGIIAGTVDAHIGVFQAKGPAPALPPPTALPQRR